MNFGLYTNGVYDIVGFTFRSRLIGILIKSEYHSVYKPYKLIDFPLYHLISDSKPQFYKK